MAVRISISAVISLGNIRNNALEGPLTLCRNLGISFVSLGDIYFVKLTLSFFPSFFVSFFFLSFLDGPLLH
jgi:hypothetical protein